MQDTRDGNTKQSKTRDKKKIKAKQKMQNKRKQKTSQNKQNKEIYISWTGLGYNVETKPTRNINEQIKIVGSVQKGLPVGSKCQEQRLWSPSGYLFIHSLIT